MGTDGGIGRRRRPPRNRGDEPAADRADGGAGKTGDADHWPFLRPDMALGLWTSWMEANAGAVRDWGGAGRPWWQVTPDDLAGSLPKSGARQLSGLLDNDPVLRSIDGLWNANPFRRIVPVDWAEVARALRIVWMRSLDRPDMAMRRAASLQTAVWQSAMEAWNDAGRRWWGMADATAADRPGSKPAPEADKRFAAPEWHANPAYRTLKEMYLLASDWLLEQGRQTDDLDDAERRRLTFHLRQFVDAMSPTLLLFSNPAALRRVLETGGVSLADGARNLLADLKEGRLSMVDATAFEPGRNLATTPGKVVHRNRLIELIQYQPAAGPVHAVPLLIIPPWINKYYILDLQPKNSMVRHLVEQGFTVFVISWKNPDSAMDGVGFEDYMDLGPLEAADVVRAITGAQSVNVMGYCIGGTLLAITLAWLAAKGDARFNSATFMVSLQDFSHVGDTAVFMGEPTVDFIEQQMMERGYLDSREMSNMFNLLRSNDLIWSNVVNNYLMGNKAPAFDLLYWNSDGTRMTRAAHSWYLRNTYVENNLIAPGRVRLKGEAIDLRRIRQDVYAVGAEKDHIVPWDAAWRVTRLLEGSTVRYVLASSGHIAGIINPPGGKGTYWTGNAGEPAPTAAEWRAKATAHSGSWWTDWTAWLAERSGKKGKPPGMGNAAHPPLADAPGLYVLET